MSYYLRVFCRSADPVPWRMIADFIDEGEYFDSVTLDPAPDAPGFDDDAWAALKVFYDGVKRPIVIYRNTDDEALQNEVSEAVSALQESAGEGAHPDLVQQLQATKQVIAIEVNKARLSDAAWSMIDSVEGFTAERFEGIIYAPDDGFFDANLKRLCQL